MGRSDGSWDDNPVRGGGLAGDGGHHTEAAELAGKAEDKVRGRLAFESGAVPTADTFRAHGPGCGRVTVVVVPVRVRTYPVPGELVGHQRTL